MIAFSYGQQVYIANLISYFFRYHLYFREKFDFCINKLCLIEFLEMFIKYQIINKTAARLIMVVYERFQQRTLLTLAYNLTVPQKS